MANKIILVVLSALFLICCQRPMTPELLQDYVSDADHGLVQQESVGDIEVRVQYRPTDLWVAQVLKRQSFSVQKIDSLRKQYGAYYYFLISFSRDGREALDTSNGLSQYSDLLQNMSFRMAQFTYLTTEKQDTIPLGDAMLNRTYGLGTSTDLLCVYSREKARDAEEITLHLEELGLGIGRQRFKFDRSKLDQAPGVDFGVVALEPR